ncbi:aminotransferase class V-fold PLP-dependent enzyme [Gordonia alkaliphila]|uniref:pyridoxal phosphate-dependent decarboxylase family protein n=1 Tax=Gordonia alkaliphila TaxID=1053547 RepID=UPI001FF13F93|nr:aminotransferase class V-fold PLP-dependent enzyme [Gordonia alkaliphila]MCK0440199.1 aminotransferase class V-fold PLP-dependent enzyme [Gordonia alkaliphila]
MSTHSEQYHRTLAELARRRATDAPTHGGRVLSYVYDSGLAELDDLAGAAAKLVQPVNGLDPTVFGSVATMERDLIAFARTAFHGPDAVGSVTSGGTESCVLAVKAARDHAGPTPGTGSIVLPATAHAAFDKAARLLGVRAVRVPVDPATTRVRPADLAAAIDDDTFLLIASAPNYPTGALDPIAEIADLARARDLPLHVDACLGGFALAWWPEPLPAWDFRVPGVTSISADFHKYGYAPKGASVILHTDRDRHRAGFFATTEWPGYPIVNPTLLGSRSAAGLASAWAITDYLGPDGFAALVAPIARATASLRAAVDAIDGLVVVGAPDGPVFAVVADPTSAAPIDPHRWSAAVADHGFTLQEQPSYTQNDGTVLPASTHLTVTPVTAAVLDDLIAALTDGAAQARGQDRAAAPEALAGLAQAFDAGALTVDDALALDSASTEAALVAAGIDPHTDPAVAGDALDLPAIIAAIELLPRPVTAKMLTEFLASYANP